MENIMGTVFFEDHPQINDIETLIPFLEENDIQYKIKDFAKGAFKVVSIDNEETLKVTQGTSSGRGKIKLFYSPDNDTAFYLESFFGWQGRGEAYRTDVYLKILSNGGDDFYNKLSILGSKEDYKIWDYERAIKEHLGVVSPSNKIKKYQSTDELAEREPEYFRKKILEALGDKILVTNLKDASFFSEIPLRKTRIGYNDNLIDFFKASKIVEKKLLPVIKRKVQNCTTRSLFETIKKFGDKNNLRSVRNYEHKGKSYAIGNCYSENDNIHKKFDDFMTKYIFKYFIDTDTMISVDDNFNIIYPIEVLNKEEAINLLLNSIERVDFTRDEIKSLAEKINQNNKIK